MTKKNESNVAEAIKGSAEHTMDASRAPVMDRDPSDGAEETSRELIQADGSLDAQLTTQLVTVISQLCLDEVEWQDRDTGEVKVSNQRKWWGKVMLRGIIRNVDFIATKQQEQAVKAEKSLDYAQNTRTGDVDPTEVVRRELVAEQATDKLLQIVAIKNLLAHEFVELFGEAHDAAKARPAAPVGQAGVRAAARAAALAAAGIR